MVGVQRYGSGFQSFIPNPAPGLQHDLGHSASPLCASVSINAKWGDSASLAPRDGMRLNSLEFLKHFESLR